ncbi:DNA-processing protein DprA [Bacillus shivajii]|uniref:DNA-processing protein DprA n=1 Tax=Bacillus shivajii TaxID=1983719 RepID=UPI001CFBE40F|nr:DNA-processing protein DprA [Bacillus shivajii]UCZ51735.1 DNA-processing protein DprA [Bacillus shivajii]
MNTSYERLLHLHYCSYGSFKLIKKIFDKDPEFKQIYEMSPKEVELHYGATYKQSTVLLQNMKRFTIEKVKKNLQERNIHVTTIFQRDYPPLLKQIYDPPWVLYYQGDLSILHNFLPISVVGTRHPSKYAYYELKQLIKPLIEHGFIIISGLALGIDKFSHEIAMNDNGKTAAVCAFGFENVYPRSNLSLFDSLKQSQLVISEYPPYVQPKKWHFPERNRIISGLSMCTLIVEAKEKSGSLITADLAMQQNRDVLALPGRLSQRESVGTNRLIQQGAKLILSVEDILEEYF